MRGSMMLDFKIKIVACDVSDASFGGGVEILLSPSLLVSIEQFVFLLLAELVF